MLPRSGRLLVALSSLTAVVAPGLLVLSPPASAGTAPSVFTTRADLSGKGESTTSLAAVHGADGGKVVTGPHDAGRVSVTGSHPVAGEPRRHAVVLLPQGVGAGTYKVSSPDPASFEGPSSFVLPGVEECWTWTATVHIHDIAWGGGLPTRLSLSGVLECSSWGGSGHAWTEVRMGQPVGTEIGQLRAGKPAGEIKTRIGTPIDVTVPFVNEGSAPVNAGPAHLRWVSDPEYPAYTVKTDGCRGKTLQPLQSCTVVVRYDPQWFTWFEASVAVTDGRPGFASTRLYGSTSELPDQPKGTIASGLDEAVQLLWAPAYQTTTNGVYQRFDVLRTGPDRVERTVASVPWQEGRKLYRWLDTGLTARTPYTYRVRVHLPSGTPGPVSRVSRARTAGRVLLYVGPAGAQQMGVDNDGKPALREELMTGGMEHAVSPDGSTWVVGTSNWSGDRCSVSRGERLGLDKMTTLEVAPAGEYPDACDADPAFASNTSVVLSRIDDTSVPGAITRLVTVDLTTGTATDVPTAPAWSSRLQRPTAAWWRWTRRPVTWCACRGRARPCRSPEPPERPTHRSTR